MTIVKINRKATISELYDLSRYVIIMTSLKSYSRYTLKHFALLDCEKLEILESVNNNGFLYTNLYVVERKGTIEEYIICREKDQNFRFDLEEDIYAQYFVDIPFYEKTIEKRWKGMSRIDNKTYSYDETGKQGWNCESFVFYILGNEPISFQARYLLDNNNNDGCSFSTGRIEGFWETRLSNKIKNRFFNNP